MDFAEAEFEDDELLAYADMPLENHEPNFGGITLLTITHVFILLVILGCFTVYITDLIKCLEV